MIVIIRSLTSAFLFLIEPALWFTLSSQKINAYLLRVNYAITVRKYKNLCLFCSLSFEQLYNDF